MIRLHPLSIESVDKHKILATFKQKDGKKIQINFQLSDSNRYSIVDYDKIYLHLTHDDPAREVITSAILNLAKARDKKVNLNDELKNLTPLSISIQEQLDDRNFSYAVKFENNGNNLEEILQLRYDEEEKALRVSWNHGNHTARFNPKAHLIVTDTETLAPELLQAVVSFDQSRYFITNESMQSLRYDECQ